jgi:hypothetical protein
MKWCLEYSIEQKQFHIETSKERFNRPVNGYQLLSYHVSQEEAERELLRIIENLIPNLAKIMNKKGE